MMQVTTVVAFFIIFQFGALVKGQSSPDADVVCPNNGQGITITISGLTDLGQWGALVSEWALNGNGANPACQARLNDPNAGEVSYGPFDASVCATLSNPPNVDYFEYVFAINPDEGPANTPVRRYDHNYTATCRYYRNGTVWANFTPIHELSASDVGSGDLNFDLNLYSDSGHVTSLTGTVNLDTTIYAQVNVTDTLSGTQLDVFLDRCWFSKDSTGLVDPYDFIVDSCEIQTPFAVDYNCDGQIDEEEDFSFPAVRYPTQVNGAAVHVHCDVYVCISDPASFCQTQCDDAACHARRKRRDADQFVGDKTYRVDAGPYRFVDVEEGQQDAGAGEQEGKPASTANLAIILSVSGVVAIAIVCVVVVVVLRKRRQNVTLAEAHDNNMKI